MKPDVLLAAILLVATILPTGSCVHVGQRLLRLEILLDGKIAFQGTKGVRDDMPVDGMWNVLDDVSFKVTPGFRDQFPGENETSLTLDGNIIFRIMHVERELSSATLTELELEKAPSESTWSVNSVEAQRVRQSVDQ